MTHPTDNGSSARSGFLSPVVVLMNLWCYSLMFLWTAVGLLIFPLMYGLCRALLRWPTDRTVRWVIWLYGRGWLLLMSPFVRFSRQQMDLLQRDTPYMLVVNHLSFFDTYCMALLPIHNIAFAVRSWPFRMFWYSKFMRMARYLDVESWSWDKCCRSSRRTFESGGSVLYFPEGHRSRDGKIQRFYSGGFKTSIAAAVPVVPLCIVGTDQLLPPGRKWLKPCRVVLRALPPIDASSYQGIDGHIRLRKEVKQQMAKELELMREGVRS